MANCWLEATNWEAICLTDNKKKNRVSGSL